MNLKRIFLVCMLPAVLFFGLSPTGATPPRRIAVEDVLFGINESHLFLLRTLSDNLETHMTELTDIVLVAKSLDHGREEEIWPVRRILEAGDIFTVDPAQRVENLRLQGQVDPFDVLAERTARPLLDSAARDASDATLQAWFTGRAFALGKWQGKPEFELSLERLGAQIDASLRATRAALPFYEGGYDPLQDASFAELAKCEATRLYLTRPIPSGPARAFVKLKCFDAENAVWSWLYAAVPAIGKLP